MPTDTTFTTLKEDVQRYLERGATLAADPIVFAQIPRLINLAERRIASEMKLQGFIEVATLTLAVGQSVYDKPTGWRRTVSMNIGVAGARTPVLPRSYEYVRAVWPDESATARPELYADYDVNHWVVAPTPDVAYPLEVVYYRQLPLLDDTNQTNWLTDIAPQMLLYATLLEASAFLKNDERVATWQGLYDRSAAAFNGEDVSKILDRASVRKEA